MTEFHPSININSQLSNIDWLVFAGACLATIMLIIYGRKKEKHLNDRQDRQNTLLEYLLMGRQLTLPLFVATLVATWYGGIFGVTQIAFEQGIYNLFTQGIFWYITYIIFAFYLVKKIRSFDAVTLPDMVKKIYGHKAAKLTAAFVFIKTLPISYAISIGLFLQCLLPLTLFEATAIGVTLIVIYALSGGLRSIVYSDVALFIIMCIGVISVLAFSIFEFGGINFLQKQLPPSYFHPCGTKSIASTIVWFFIACSATFISPAFYQRCLAAINDRTAVLGILFATVIWFIFDICTTFGAMYARAVIPEAHSLNAYIIYSVQLLPNGFKGLLLASVAAAIIATLDSFLFIASNTLFYDLPIFKLKNLKLQHTLAIIITAVLTVIISLAFEGHIESCWLILKSYFSACLLLPLLFGYIFTRFANEMLFILSSLISCISITVWIMFFQKQFPHIDSFYIGCLTSSIVFSAYYLTLDTRITILIERIRRMI